MVPGVSPITATSQCTTGDDATVRSVVTYKGMSYVNAPTTIVVNGYTLVFDTSTSMTGPPATVGAIAVTISGPGITGSLQLAEVSCAGATYPLDVSLSSRAAGFSHGVPSSSGGSSTSETLLLVAVVLAFLAINVAGFRTLRHRHATRN